MNNRATLALVTLLFALFARAQNEAPKPSLFDTVRPDLTLLVRKHSMGADLVEVTATSAAYKPDELKAQCTRLGEILGTPPRGLRIYAKEVQKDDPRMVFVSASFAVDGLVRVSDGKVALEAIAQAFGPSSAVSGLTLILSDIRPGPATARKFASSAWSFEARYSSFPAGLEYRVLLSSDEAKDLVLPGSPEPTLQKAASGGRSPVDGVAFWSLLALIGASIGALVYFFALRHTQRAGPF